MKLPIKFMDGCFGSCFHGAAKAALRTAVLMMAVALLGACEGDSANDSPIGPDISGSWSGTYTYPGQAPARISAVITQNGRSLFIETSLPDTGRLFTGELNRDGGLYMTDASDGETWTNAGEPVTTERVVLLDYATGAGSGLRRIELTK